MKITIVQGAFFPVPPVMGGGVEKVWFALGQEFARRGHEVTHISRQFPGQPNEETSENVRRIRVRGFDTPRFLAYLKFLDLLYSRRVLQHLPSADILVTNTFWLPVLVRSGKSGLIYVHVARYPRGQLRFYSHVARLQAVSEPVAMAIRAEVPALANLVSSIPNPLPPEAFAPLGTESPGLQEKRVLYVGRIHPEKGVHLLLEAFARIPPEHRIGWKLRIVGPAETRFGGGGSPYLRKLHRIARPIAGVVEWIGAEFDACKLTEHYRQSALFLYPSLAERGETFGLAPLEAMAQGCPALVSDLACFREFLHAGKNGFVFDHRASDAAGALAREMASLLADPSRLTAASVRARARVEDFRLEPVATRYLEDFAGLLRKQ